MLRLIKVTAGTDQELFATDDLVIVPGRNGFNIDFRWQADGSISVTYPNQAFFNGTILYTTTELNTSYHSSGYAVGFELMSGSMILDYLQVCRS